MRRAIPPAAIKLGIALLAFGFWAAGECLAAADARGLDCAGCHDQAQKLAKSAHAGLTCDTCHDSHDQYPHKAGIPKPQ